MYIQQLPHQLKHVFSTFTTFIYIYQHFNTLIFFHYRKISKKTKTGSISTTDGTSDILDIVQPPLIGRGRVYKTQNKHKYITY